MFDPTVGPLIELWSRAGESGRLPAAAAIAEARSRVGIERIAIDAAGRVTLPPGMAVNFGGIGKGWALDRMRELLAERGIANALLDFGGSSWLALGAPADAPAWRVLLRDGRGGYAGAVSLRDTSVSFSESFGESSEIEGRRYGHVIDPRTGWPIQEARAGVALAADGATAEALTKALIVLGAREGLAVVAQTPGAEALVIDAAGGLHESPGFRRATAFEPLRLSDAVWRFLHRVAAGLWDARNFLLRPAVTGRGRARPRGRRAAAGADLVSALVRGAGRRRAARRGAAPRRRARAARGDRASWSRPTPCARSASSSCATPSSRTTCTPSSSASTRIPRCASIGARWCGRASVPEASLGELPLWPVLPVLLAAAAASRRSRSGRGTRSGARLPGGGGKGLARSTASRVERARISGGRPTSEVPASTPRASIARRTVTTPSMPRLRAIDG